MSYTKALEHLKSARTEMNKMIVNDLNDGQIYGPKEQIQLCYTIKALEEAVEKLTKYE